MDLNNLTFDELLDAIRSDSGYQNAQAQKIKKEKTTAAPIKELPTEKIPEVSEEPVAEAVEEAPAAE